MPRNDGSAAAQLLVELRRRGWSVGAAESLTGGLVAAAIIDVPGASAAMRGGVVAYDTRVKRELLGVDGDLLAVHGAVHADVARQMSEGVRRALRVDGSDADVGLATTGIAGPESPDGQPVGLVHLGVSTPEGYWGSRHVYAGTRDEIRRGAAHGVIALAVEALTSARE
ncbi:CinA family protein [Microbacterium gubbeenense]|uniref:CinA family protein n=1 Tax=Microbacterium gubbeenense TaxID=159896 RepID=UPI000412BA95|nr:CinA family protein [Microbacterium gubbeenense]